MYRWVFREKESVCVWEKKMKSKAAKANAAAAAALNYFTRVNLKLIKTVKLWGNQQQWDGAQWTESESESKWITCANVWIGTGWDGVLRNWKHKKMVSMDTIFHSFTKNESLLSSSILSNFSNFSKLLDNMKSCVHLGGGSEWWTTHFQLENIERPWWNLPRSSHKSSKVFRSLPIEQWVVHYSKPPLD